MIPDPFFSKRKVDEIEGGLAAQRQDGRHHQPGKHRLRGDSRPANRGLRNIERRGQVGAVELSPQIMDPEWDGIEADEQK